MATQGTFLIRRGLASSWELVNPVLMLGQIGFETDTRRFKVGTGTVYWNELDYAAPQTGLTIPFNGAAIGLLMPKDDPGDPDVFATNVDEAIRALDYLVDILKSKLIESDDGSITIERDGQLIDISTHAGIIPFISGAASWLSDESIELALRRLGATTGDPANLDTEANNLVGAVNEVKESLTEVIDELLYSPDTSITITRPVPTDPTDPRPFHTVVNPAATAFARPSWAGQTAVDPNVQFLSQAVDWLRANTTIREFDDGTAQMTIHQGTGIVTFNTTSDNTGWRLGGGLLEATEDGREFSTGNGGVMNVDTVNQRVSILGLYQPGEHEGTVTNDDDTTTDVYVLVELGHQEIAGTGPRLLLMSNGRLYLTTTDGFDVSYTQEVGAGGAGGGLGTQYLWTDADNGELGPIPAGSFMTAFTFNPTTGEYTPTATARIMVGQQVKLIRTEAVLENGVTYRTMISATGIITQVDGWPASPTALLQVTRHSKTKHDYTIDFGGNTIPMRREIQDQGDDYLIVDEALDNSDLDDEHITYSALGITTGVLPLAGVIQRNKLGENKYLGLLEGVGIYSKGGETPTDPLNEIVRERELGIVDTNSRNRDGLLTNLTTTAQTNLVAAINEVNAKTDQLSNFIGHVTFVAVTATDVGAISPPPADLDTLFRWDTSTFYYWTTTTSAWVPLPAAGLIKARFLVRLASEVAGITTMVPGDRVGVIENGTVLSWDGTAWQPTTVPVIGSGDIFRAEFFYGTVRDQELRGDATAVIMMTDAGWTKQVSSFLDFTFTDLKDSDWS